jgi:hypothetical protein
MDFLATQPMLTREVLARQAEGQQTWIDGKVADFNSRPARRYTDIRIQGWKIIEAEMA